MRSLIWDREWRWLGKLRPLWGVALTMLVVAPWSIAIALESHGAFYQQSLGHDFAAKLAGGQESHGAPPGYYLLLATLTFWPATLFVVPGSWQRPSAPSRAGGALSARLGRCVLADVRIVPTKLPHYILPAYPALAIMAARSCWRRARRSAAAGGAILPIVSAVQFLLGAALLAAAHRRSCPDLYGTGTPGDSDALPPAGRGSRRGVAVILHAARVEGAGGGLRDADRAGRSIRC